MEIRKKTRNEQIINIGYTILLATIHWWAMWSYRYESVFYLYVYLLVYIFANLLLVNILWKRRLRKKTKKPKNIVTKILYFIFLPIKQDFACVKTSLYLFFAVILVVSQVTSLAEIAISSEMRDLLDAVQYGFAPLIAFDQVFNQFRNDQVTYAEKESDEALE